MSTASTSRLVVSSIYQPAQQDWMTNLYSGIQFQPGSFHEQFELGGKRPMNRNRRERVVDMYLVDPDKSLSIQDRLVFSTKTPVFTDLFDEELWLDPDIIAQNAKNGERTIVDIIHHHNELRARTRDKQVLREGGREVTLEPVTFGDLLQWVVVRAGG